MPLAESNPAATLTFDAAVHRALARRPADTPWPHNGAPVPHAVQHAASATPATQAAGNAAGNRGERKPG